MRQLIFVLFFLSNKVVGDDRVFADENDRQIMAQRYERCLELVHADTPISQSTKKPVSGAADLNDIVNIRSRNVSGPHFASGTNFKLKPLLLWPDGLVPTDFDGQFTNEESDKIRCAVAFFHGFTCIRFIKRKPNHADYLLISKSKSGCFSETVGKIEGGGYQVINLDQFNDHCWHHGTIVHELMHAVGRFHEHSRMDNKEYIHIHFNNIPQSDHFQYQTPKQMGYEQKDVGYYDYASIMHYPMKIGDKRVISAAFKGDYDQQDRNNDAMGQRNRPSKQDEVKFNLLYKCNGNGQSTMEMTKVTVTTRVTPTTTTTSVELADFVGQCNLKGMEPNKKSIYYRGSCIVRRSDILLNFDLAKTACNDFGEEYSGHLVHILDNRMSTFLTNNDMIWTGSHWKFVGVRQMNKTNEPENNWYWINEKGQLSRSNVGNDMVPMATR